MACTQAELNTVAKTQTVRLLDVFLIGPLMIWGGLAVADRNEIRTCGLAGGALVLLGFSTIAYNARNWTAVEEARMAP